MIGLFGIDSILDANEDKPICLELHRRILPCISLGIILSSVDFHSLVPGSHSSSPSGLIFNALVWTSLRELSGFNLLLSSPF